LSSGFSDHIQNSARGSLFLFFGQITSAVISAVTVIFVARIIGAESYGEYTIALIPIGLANLVSDVGVSSAMTRFCAVYRKEGNAKDLEAVVKTGMIFTAVVSLLFALGIYFASGWIASAFMQRPDLEYLSKAASMAVLGNGLLTSVMATMVGYENMFMRSSMQIFYNLLRGALSIVLVLAGMGSFGQVISYTASNVLAGVAVTILLFFVVKFEPRKGVRDEWGVFKRMMAFGFPFYMKNLVISGLNQLYQTLMTIYVAVELIGNYGAARNFGVLVSFLTIPIGTVLFPLFSRYEGDDDKLKILYHKAVKYTTMVTLPVVACIILVSEPLSIELFGEGYSYLPAYLSLFILTYAFEGLGGTAQDYLILGIGKARVSFIAGVITFVSGTVLSITLIPRYQIIGLLVSSLTAPRIGWIYSTLWLRRNLGFNANWSSSLKVYVSTGAAFLFSYAIIFTLRLQGWTALIIGAGAFLVVYIVALPITGVLDKGALRELRRVSEAFGPLAPVINFVISMVQLLVRG
jgi:O-antigen/teichoic acid export membrane protein